MSEVPEPATAGKRSFLVTLDRTLRAVGAKALPFGPRAVLRAMAGRADPDGILYPALETIAQEAGTWPPTARRHLDALDKLGWYEVVEQATARKSAKYRLRLTPEPKAADAGVSQRSPWRKETAIVSQADRSSPAARLLASPRQTAVVPEDHRKVPGRSQEAPIAITPAQARAGSPHQQGLPELQSGGLGASPTPLRPAPLVLAVQDPAATSTPLPKSGKRRKDPDAPKAWQTYSAAFVEGHKLAGGDVVPPTEAEATAIGRAAAALAKYRDGQPITGADLREWIKRRARKFRDDVSDPDRHPGGWSARGLCNWLNNGHAGKPWLRPEERAALERPPEPPPPVTAPTATPPREPSKYIDARTAALLKEYGRNYDHLLPPAEASNG